MIPEGIVPSHRYTQHVLDREVNEWWASLTLAQRLGIHAQANAEEPNP